MQLALAYASAHFGKTLLWSFLNTFFLFFAIYVLGLTPLRASLFVFILAVIDTAVDLAAAKIIYKFQRKLKGMAAWVILFTPVCALSLFCVFYAPLMKTFEGLFWVLIAAMICRMTFTFVDIPLNASIGRFNYQSKHRNYIAAARSIAATFAKILLALLTFIYAEQKGDIQGQDLWKVAAFIAILSPLAIIPAFIPIDRKARQYEASPAEKPESTPPFKALISRNIALLFLANIAFLLLTSQFATALIFMIENDPTIKAPFSLIWLLISFISALTVWPWMKAACHFQKSHMTLAALIGTAIIMVFFPVLKTSVTGIIVFICLYAAVFHINSLIWSMLPDSVDEINTKTGQPAHALIIGLFAAFGKLTIGAAQLLTGLFLQYSGFPHAPDYNKYQNITLTLTISGCLITFLLLSQYNLSHEKHANLPKPLSKPDPN